MNFEQAIRASRYNTAVYHGVEGRMFFVEQFAGEHFLYRLRDGRLESAYRYDPDVVDHDNLPGAGRV